MQLTAQEKAVSLWILIIYCSLSSFQGQLDLNKVVPDIPLGSPSAKLAALDLF